MKDYRAVLGLCGTSEPCASVPPRGSPLPDLFPCSGCPSSYLPSSPRPRPPPPPPRPPPVSPSLLLLLRDPGSVSHVLSNAGPFRYCLPVFLLLQRRDHVRSFNLENASDGRLRSPRLFPSLFSYILSSVPSSDRAPCSDSLPAEIRYAASSLPGVRDLGAERTPSQHRHSDESVLPSGENGGRLGHQGHRDRARSIVPASESFPAVYGE